jgi:hypothetical protein
MMLRLQFNNRVALSSCNRQAFADRVFDGVGPFKIALNDFFKMNNQLTVDKFDQAIDKELTIANSKTRKKMKP